MLESSLDSIQNRAPHRIEHGIRSWIDQDAIDSPIKLADITAYNYRAQAFNPNAPLPLSVRDESALAPLFALPHDAFILELGGGDGRFGHALMRRGFTNVIESDISSTSVQRAEQAARAQQLHGHFCTIDSEQIPFKDGSLDAVFMVASLHHVPSAQKVIAEMKRVLKPGGLLCILREPASWQYYLFYPAFKLIRTVVRRDSDAPHSLADDTTFGFTQRFFRAQLSDLRALRIVPVHYTRKVYTNLVELCNKVLKTELTCTPGLLHACETLDRGIAHIPFVRSLAWDWDVYAIKQ